MGRKKRYKLPAILKRLDIEDPQEQISFTCSLYNASGLSLDELKRGLTEEQLTRALIKLNARAE